MRVGRENVEFSKDEFRWDGWHFCVSCQMVCMYLCGGAREGDIHLVKLRTELVCHLA